MKTFITTALPYANGDLHWGHFFEAVIADIYAKYKKVPLISGDDQHGAAITLFASKHGLDIHSHLQAQHYNHCQQYQQLGIDFISFGQTHNQFHQKLVLYCYQQLSQKGLIVPQITVSWFDQEKQQFLPDRYVRGTCPHCGTSDVYPHICDHCNHHFESSKLLNPVSSLSLTTPILKETTHYFLNTESFFERLSEFCTQLNLHPSVKKKILDKSLDALTSIDITRDTPYFGIPVPNQELAFYVWFDAPLAYLSFILEQHNIDKNVTIEECFEQLQTIEIEHFIGKDIIYFHTFYWLNLLHILNVPLPKKLHVHGWIVHKSGEKYAKSNGDKLDLAQFSGEQIDAIRLFFATHYDGSIQDSEFSLEKAYILYNQYIVGKYINIYSRISKLCVKNQFLALIKQDSIYTWKEHVEEAFAQCNLKNATKYLFSWIDEINGFIQDHRPWAVSQKECHDISQIALNEFHHIAPYIALICPHVGAVLKNIDFNHIEHRHLSARIA